MSHSRLENNLHDALLSSTSSLSSTGINMTQPSGNSTKGKFNLSEKEQLERQYKAQNYAKYELQLQSDDDKISVSSGTGDFRPDIDDFFGPSNGDQLQFYWFLVFTLCADITLLILTYMFPEAVISRMVVKTYRDLTIPEKTGLFVCIMSIKLVYGAFYYSIAFKASTSKSSQLLKTFCTLSKVGAVLELILACFNCYELCILMFRIFALVLASSLNEKLMILVLLPQRRDKHLSFSI